MNFTDLNSRYNYRENLLLEARDAVKNEVYNLLKIPIRSVPFNRTLGTKAEGFLQEPISEMTAFKIETALFDAIELHLPRIKVRNGDVVVRLDKSNTGYIVDIRYLITNIAATDTLSLPVSRGR